MKIRSIISIFIVFCLIIVTFFGNVVEGERALQNTKRNNIHSNKNNIFVQRLRRRVRNTHRRSKRQDGDDNSFDNQNTGGDGNNLAGQGDGSRGPPDFSSQQGSFLGPQSNNRFRPYLAQTVQNPNSFDQFPSQDQQSNNDQGSQYGDQR